MEVGTGTQETGNVVSWEQTIQTTLPSLQATSSFSGLYVFANVPSFSSPVLTKNDFEVLRSYLVSQKNNIQTLLQEQDQKLQKRSLEAKLVNWDISQYEALECLDVQGVHSLDWTLPTSMLQKMIIDDYVTLAMKVHQLEMDYELLQSTSLQSQIDSLYLQIAMYGEWYKNMIVQMAQKTLNRLQTNEVSVKKFMKENEAELLVLAAERKKIKALLSSYYDFQKSLSFSRILYWFTFQDLGAQKTLTKNWYALLFRKQLTDRIEFMAKKNSVYIPFGKKLEEIGSSIEREFSTSYDTWFATIIGKIVDETTMSVIDTSVKTIQTTYFDAMDKMQCGPMLSLSSQDKKDQELLLAKINQLRTWLIGSWSDDGANGTAQRDQWRREYNQQLQIFYQEITQKMIEKFDMQVQEEVAIYFKIVSVEMRDLAILNELNQKYRTIENIDEKSRLRIDEIYPKAIALSRFTISTAIKDRCDVIIRAMEKEATIYAPQEDVVEQVVVPVVPDSSLTSSDSVAVPTPGTPAPVAIDQTVQDAVNQYLITLEQKYPDATERAVAAKVMSSNIDTKLTGDLDPQMRTIYENLKKKLTEVYRL